MNTELTIALTSNTTVQTMSSREIAELTGKQHQHVKRDIESMFEQLGEDASSFGRIYFDSMNRQQTEYHLPKRETLILVSGYSVVLRSRIIDRWQELEAAAAQPQPAAPTVPDFVNPAEAARVCVLGRERRPFHPHSGYSHSWVRCGNY